MHLHWSDANRFPGTVWSPAALVIGLLAPFALVIRYAGFPGAWPPVWLPLLDPAVHAAAAAALLAWFRRQERLDAWHLGLDRARIDAAAARTLWLLGAALPAAIAALADPSWIPRAPEIFAPASALLRAADFQAGTGTRLVAAAFAASQAGATGPAQEIILTGLLYPTLRRRLPVLPSAAACAGTGALLHARATECGIDPCLWPALQAAGAQAAAALASALLYERYRTLWIPILWRAGFALARMAPGLAVALAC